MRRLYATVTRGWVVNPLSSMCPAKEELNLSAPYQRQKRSESRTHLFSLVRQRHEDGRLDIDPVEKLELPLRSYLEVQCSYNQPLTVDPTVVITQQ